SADPAARPVGQPAASVRLQPCSRAFDPCVADPWLSPLADAAPHDGLSQSAQPEILIGGCADSTIESGRAHRPSGMTGLPESRSSQPEGTGREPRRILATNPLRC